MKVYFGGIGGVGIGPLAQIALDAGYTICGSEPSFGLMRSQLEARGVEISSDQTGQFLESTHADSPIDWYVHTAAMPETHPEIVAARRLGIKLSKRDEFLAELIAKKNLKLIAVAGTHGKTTTSGMMVWALKQLGIPVSYSIGSTLSWGASGAYDPRSMYFVYECDEFDRNFLHFKPHLSVITSIEHDHPDSYPTEADYMLAFSQFVDQSEKTIAWSRDTSKLTINDANNWQLDDQEIVDVDLAGLHNRQNATLVIKALEYLNIRDYPARIQAIESFPGTGRRFEKLADNLYSDYGHTPTEIAATLQLAREISDNVTLVYQPHQNTRQHEIRQQYSDQVFSLAEHTFWLPTYLSRENPDLTLLSPADLTSQLTNVSIAELDDRLWQSIVDARKNGSLVLVMGAGDIDTWLRSRLAE